jgi:hypothetical protein
MPPSPASRYVLQVPETREDRAPPVAHAAQPITAAAMRVDSVTHAAMSAAVAAVGSECSEALERQQGTLTPPVRAHAGGTLEVLPQHMALRAAPDLLAARHTATPAPTPPESDAHAALDAAQQSASARRTALADSVAALSEEDGFRFAAGHAPAEMPPQAPSHVRGRAACAHVGATGASCVARLT